MNRRLAPIAILLVLLPIIASAQPTTSPSERPLRMVIIGDRTGDAQKGIFPAIITEMARLRPDLAVSVGDLIEGYTNDTTTLNKEWAEIKSMLSPLDCPIYYTPGNHDITFDGMQASFEKHIGPPFHSIDYEGLHIVILDNSRADLLTEFSADQIEWVKNDLEASQAAKWTIVFMHKPFWYRTVADNQPDTLHNLFKTYGVEAVFTGHHHRYFSGEYDGILYTGMGSSGGGAEDNPPGMQYHFAWVTLDESGVHIAPVKMGSIATWAVQTADDVRSMYVVENNAVTFAQPLPVSQNLTIDNQDFTIQLTNMLADQTASGKVEWELPEGWTITPDQQPFDLEPNGTQSVKFTANSTGNLYPLPSYSLTLPYTSDKERKLSYEIECSRQITAFRATVPPKIDGRLDESLWSEPVTKLFAPDGKASECDSTAVFFAYDDQNLYIAAYCHEDQIEKLAATMTNHDDAVYGEDSFGFMILPPGEDLSGYQFYANPLGTVYDQRLIRGSDGYYSADNSWSGQINIKTSQGDNYWAIEIRLPLDQFGVKAMEGDSWRLTFRRKQARVGNSAALQVPWSYNPTKFGQILFK